MPNWDNQADKAPATLGTARVEWHRRGRWLRVLAPIGNGNALNLQIELAQLARECHIAREDILAIADDAELAPMPDHPDLATERYGEREQMRLAALPADCTGKTVLDIGGWDGEFAAACLRRGATDALVFDSGQYVDYTWVRPVERPGVRYKRGDLMDFSHDPAPAADIVLLYNVIYHIRDPWMALERCRLLTRDTFVICTSFVPGDEPVWRLFSKEDERAAGGVINDRYTVFWRPTIAGLLKLLHVVGFTDCEVFGPVEDHVCVRCR